MKQSRLSFAILYLSFIFLCMIIIYKSCDHWYKSFSLENIAQDYQRIAPTCQSPASTWIITKSLERKLCHSWRSSQVHNHNRRRQSPDETQSLRRSPQLLFGSYFFVFPRNRLPRSSQSVDSDGGKKKRDSAHTKQMKKWTRSQRSGSASFTRASVLKYAEW